MPVPLTWDPAPGAASYRVHYDSTPRSVMRSSHSLDVASTSWSSIEPGSLFYIVTALDGCGREVP